MNKILPVFFGLLLLASRPVFAMDANFCQQNPGITNTTFANYVGELCASATTMRTALKNNDKSDSQSNPDSVAQVALGAPAPSNTMISGTPIPIAPAQPTPNAATTSNSRTPNIYSNS